MACNYACVSRVDHSDGLSNYNSTLPYPIDVICLSSDDEVDGGLPDDNKTGAVEMEEIGNRNFSLPKKRMTPISLKSPSLGIQNHKKQKSPQLYVRPSPFRLSQSSPKRNSKIGTIFQNTNSSYRSKNKEANVDHEQIVKEIFVESEIQEDIAAISSNKMRFMKILGLNPAANADGNSESVSKVESENKSQPSSSETGMENVKLNRLITSSESSGSSSSDDGDETMYRRQTRFVKHTIKNVDISSALGQIYMNKAYGQQSFYKDQLLEDKQYPFKYERHCQALQTDNQSFQYACTRQTTKWPITFRASLHGSRSHSYKFSKVDKNEWLATSRSGLNRRSRALLKSVRKNIVGVHIERLSREQLEECIFLNPAKPLDLSIKEYLETCARQAAHRLKKEQQIQPCSNSEKTTKTRMTARKSTGGLIGLPVRSIEILSTHVRDKHCQFTCNICAKSIYQGYWYPRFVPNQIHKHLSEFHGGMDYKLQIRYAAKNNRQLAIVEAFSVPQQGQCDDIEIVEMRGPTCLPGRCKEIIQIKTVPRSSHVKSNHRQPGPMGGARLTNQAQNNYVASMPLISKNSSHPRPAFLQRSPMRPTRPHFKETKTLYTNDQQVQIGRPRCQNPTPIAMYRAAGNATNMGQDDFVAISRSNLSIVAKSQVPSTIARIRSLKQAVTMQNGYAHATHSVNTKVVSRNIRHPHPYPARFAMSIPQQNPQVTSMRPAPTQMQYVRPLHGFGAPVPTALVNSSKQLSTCSNNNVSEPGNITDFHTPEQECINLSGSDDDDDIIILD